MYVASVVHHYLSKSCLPRTSLNGTEMHEIRHERWATLLKRRKWTHLARILVHEEKTGASYNFLFDSETEFLSKLMQ